MKTFFQLSFTLLLLSFWACSGNEKDNPTPSIQSTSPNLFEVSKATSNFADLNFAEGDVIGLYITQRANESTAGVLVPTGNLFDNKRFTYSDGVMTASESENYPQGVMWVDMYGYAPYSQTALDADNKLLFTVKSDQSSTLSTSDLLWVTKPAVQTTSAAPALIFSHKLTKVVVKLTAGVGVTFASPAVTINNTLPTVKLDMAHGTLSTAQGAASGIQTYKSSSTEFCAIIVPQHVTVLGNFITIANGGKTYNYTLPTAKQFEEGKLYVYEITVNTDDLSVNISGSVNDWNTGDTTTGEAQ